MGASAFVTRESHRTFATMDAVASVVRALDLVEGITSDETIAVVRRAAEARQDTDADIWESATELGIDLSRAACAAILRAHAEEWNDSGYEALYVKGPEAPLEQQQHRGWPLTYAWDALYAAATIAIGLDDGETEDAVLVRSLADLALGAEATDKVEVATACALSASNFANTMSVASLQTVDLAIRLCIASNTEDPLFGLRFKRVQVLAALATDDTELRATAFEAMEALLWHLPSDPDRRSMTLALADQIVRNSTFLKSLRPLLVVANASSPSALPKGSADAWLFGQRIWEIPSGDVASAADVVSVLAIEQENAHLALLAPAGGGHAETTWTTWSFRHPGLSRAMPQFASLLRERDLDELILSVAHETTHVLSMLGGLAYPVLALRAARLDVEFRLWAVLTNNQPVEAERVRSIGLAPLTDPSVLALAQVEQALELTLKLRGITGVWTSWFEGLAVFAETAADPILDPEVSSFVATVVGNLVDVDVPRLANQRGQAVSETYRAALDDGERLWSTAIQRFSQERLWLQLVTYHQRYLAGYLAVRSIVSRWREKRPDLTGAQAFRLLLHLTQFGTHGVVPDLGLPTEAVAKDARKRFLQWIAWIQKIDAATLDTFFSDHRARFGWVDGELVLNPQIDESDLLERAVRGSLRTLTNSTDLDRLGPIDDDSRELLRIVQEALALASPTAIEQGFAERLSSSVTALPISEQDCLFWLVRSELRLLTLVRTTSLDREQERQGHYLISTELTEAELTELEREIQRQKASRMRVARIANLATSEPAGEGTGVGRHYIAYSYGSWIHVTNAGLAAGSIRKPDDHLVGKFQERLGQDSLLAFESRWIGLGMSGARRTLDWLEATDQRWAELGLPVEALRDHVRQRAEIVAATTVDEAASDLGPELIRIAFGKDKRSEALLKSGLRAFRDIDPSWPAAVVRMLDATGRGRVEDAWLEANSSKLAAAVGPLFTKGKGGWDVTPGGG
jgi:hypothetical protein